MAGSDGQPLTLGTAGHIDHGKTVLVEALTGVNTDRLPEERARGISIELGFAPMALPSGRLLSVVDVPGHERFVRTMVAGSTGVDMFLLVIAADDGVMPQTREHLAVLSALEVPAGAVAVTKTDLVDDDGLALVRDEIGALLDGSPYAAAPVIAVSAPAGHGIAELAAALEEVAGALPERRPVEAAARLHVDRAFTLRGIGTVVTGTLWSDSVQVGEVVRIEPPGLTARVRGIEVHGRPRQRALPGQRVALNLAGIDRRQVERGDVVCSDSAELRSTYLLDVAVELNARAKPLGRGARVHVHHGTREAPARVAPVAGEVIEPGVRGYAQLRLERPLVAAGGDRFVLRQVAPPDTIGGGLVVDPAPRKHGAGDEQATRLELLERGDPLDRLAAELDRTPSGLGEQDGDRELLDRLCGDGRARRVGGAKPRYFAPAPLERARAAILEAVRAGGPRPLSRGALAGAAGVSDPAAAAVLDELVASGEVVARGPGFMAAGEEFATDPDLRSVVDLLRAGGLEPDGPKPLAAALGLPEAQVRELLDQAVHAGLVARLRNGVYYHPDALAAAREHVAAACHRDGGVTIASMRDELGTSRKYAQALLEHFDAERLTRRVGDRHVLRTRHPS